MLSGQQEEGEEGGCVGMNGREESEGDIFYLHSTPRAPPQLCPSFCASLHTKAADDGCPREPGSLFFHLENQKIGHSGGSIQTPDQKELQ